MKEMKKKGSQPALIHSPSRYTGNNFFLRVASHALIFLGYLNDHGTTAYIGHKCKGGMLDNNQDRLCTPPTPTPSHATFIRPGAPLF